MGLHYGVAQDPMKRVALLQGPSYAGNPAAQVPQRLGHYNPNNHATNHEIQVLEPETQDPEPHDQQHLPNKTRTCKKDALETTGLLRACNINFELKAVGHVPRG